MSKFVAQIGAYEHYCTPIGCSTVTKDHCGARLLAFGLWLLARKKLLTKHQKNGQRYLGIDKEQTAFSLWPMAFGKKKS